MRFRSESVPCPSCWQSITEKITRDATQFGTRSPTSTKLCKRRFVLLALSSTGKKKGSFHKCMSFVPAPQQANAAGSNNAPSNSQVTTSNAAAAATETSDMEAVFKIRTFDVYWVDKSALMYRDGIDKVCIPVLITSRTCLVWAHISSSTRMLRRVQRESCTSTTRSS